MRFFEVSIALKYLIPRIRYLSVSIISIISILVIATVVWLTVIFFSVTEGLEKRWTEKLVSITAPVRISPTDKYYNSYYYQIDAFSQKSGYTTKSLSEKLASVTSNPYNPQIDQELAPSFPKPLYDKNGNIVDLAKEMKQAALNVSVAEPINVQPFDTAFANVKLQLFRKDFFSQDDSGSKIVTQASYLVNFDPHKLEFQQTLMPVSSSDLDNLLDTIDDVSLNQNATQKKILFDKLIKEFFDRVEIETLKTPLYGFQIPLQLLPENKKFNVLAQFSPYLTPELILMEKESKIPQDQGWQIGSFEKRNGTIYYTQDGKRQELQRAAVKISRNSSIPCKLIKNFHNVNVSQELEFEIKKEIQGILLSGKVQKGNLQIENYRILRSDKSAPLWLEKQGNSLVLPKNELGEGVLLPKSFRESGVLLGDRGSLSFLAPSATHLTEQKVPIYVAGFYDPGIIPIGGKLILARPEVVALIQATIPAQEKLFPTGLNVNFLDFRKAHEMKKQIEENLKKAHLSDYFTVQSYDEYDFTKDIFQQLKSEKNLFSLISIIIVIVACSNIVSMLIILVHDKQKEIAILRALGASKMSIGCIFGLSGLIMGACGSILGALLSYVTVKNMPALLGFLGKLQGFDVLNTAFYGTSIPTDISLQALVLVITATAIVSTLAGMVAALKASRQNTSDALRAD